MKSDRLQRVMRLGCTHAQERSERYMGRVEEVLVEERNPKDASQVRKPCVRDRFVFYEKTVSP